MTNVTIETRPDGMIALIFDPKADHGPSSTGKTRTVATTHGAVACPGMPEVKIGLNVYRKS